MPQHHVPARKRSAAVSERIVVCRCPECGSRDAYPDESQSAYDLTFMYCNGCKSGGLVDAWQRDAWYIDIRAADGP